MPFHIFSGLQSTQIWSINYALHFVSIKIHKRCLYWSVFSTDINRKIILNILLLFKLFCWEVNYMSRIGKFYNIFLACSETDAWCIFEGFQYCHLGKVEFQLFSIFKLFLIWCVNYWSHFLATFCRSVWVESLISEMSRSLSITLCLRPFSIAIYEKFDSCSLYFFRIFSYL